MLALQQSAEVTFQHQGGGSSDRSDPPPPPPPPRLRACNNMTLMVAQRCDENEMPDLKDLPWLCHCWWCSWHQVHSSRSSSSWRDAASGRPRHHTASSATVPDSRGTGRLSCTSTTSWLKLPPHLTQSVPHFQRLHHLQLFLNYTKIVPFHNRI